MRHRVPGPLIPLSCHPAFCGSWTPPRTQVTLANLAFSLVCRLGSELLIAPTLDPRALCDA